MTKRVLLVAAKSFGLAGVAGLVVASYIINVVLERSEQMLITYEKDAKFVASQMQSAIQKNQIDLHGQAIIAHLQLTGRHERQMAQYEGQLAQYRGQVVQLQTQNQQQQQLLMDREQTAADQERRIDDLSSQFQAFLARSQNQPHEA